jgi:thymidylate kinase
MKKFVIAVEGGDGSGKSTAIRHTMDLCCQIGVPFSLIGRGVTDSVPSIHALTSVLREHGSNYSLHSDLAIRVAREFVRAQIAASVSSGIVILDRFVISLLARNIADNINMDWVESSLVDTVRLSELDATLFIDCPFDVAWSRCQKALRSGVREVSLKDTRGAEYNQKFAMHQKQVFESSSLAMTKMTICNSQDELTFSRQIREKITPIVSQLSID